MMVRVVIESWYPRHRARKKLSYWLSLDGPVEEKVSGREAERKELVVIFVF